MLFLFSVVLSFTACHSDKNEEDNCPLTPTVREEYCLETYEEFIDAVDTLRAHGNKYVSLSVYNCEGILLNGKEVDVKYYISFETEEPLEEGKNAFARKVSQISMGWALFEEYMPIGEVDPSKQVLFTSSFPSGVYNSSIEIEDRELINVFVWGWDQEAFWNPEERYGDDDIIAIFGAPSSFYITYNGENLCEFRLNKDKYTTYSSFPPKEFFDQVAKSVVIIKGNFYDKIAEGSEMSKIPHPAEFERYYNL